MRLKTDRPLDQAKAYEVIWDQVAPIFEATRQVQNPSFVYLIAESGGPIKIGVATNPIKRLRTMQTGNPRRLRIEWVLVGDRNLERALHRLWQPFAIKSAEHETKVRRLLRPDLRAAGTEWFQADIREDLLPVIETAVKSQVALLKDARDDISFRDLGAVVIKAHQEHGFIFSESKTFEDDGWDFARTSA